MTLATPQLQEFRGYGDHLSVVNIFVNNFAYYGMSVALPVSGTYPSANRAHYFPVNISYPFLIKRFWAFNGATAAGNTDVGIYKSNGTGGAPSTRIISSGAVAQAGTNVIQYFDVTDTWITPGLYWLALSSSLATSTFFRSQLSGSGGDFFNASENTANPLPATATPVFPAASNLLPIFGMTQRATP